MTDDTQTDDAEFTVQLNGKEFELNKEARQAIQDRASSEYEKNQMFSCFWKTAHPNQYSDGEWEQTIHDTGDPVLVIETEGPMAPWERLDKLNVEMQEVGPESQLDREMDDNNNGNGVKTIDPSEVDDAEKTIGRTHFSVTPKSFEEVPDPDGEEEDKIPAKPVEVGDSPEMITWVPDHPDIDHSWAAGEAICTMYNRVEWNVQAKANQPRLTEDKDTSHDHWESLLKSHDCDKLGELAPSQRTPSGSSQNSKSEEDVADKFKNGKYGGNNWQV